MNILKKFKFLFQIQLTDAIQRGYKVHFLKGPAAERIFTSFEQKQLFDIVNISQKIHSYLIFNPQRTLQQIQNWKKQLDWITPFYAIKANFASEHLEIVKQQNLGFDCASESEISKIISMNGDPSRIILSNTIKKINDLNYAAQQNVNLTTADTIDELYKIKAYHPNCEILWRIAIPEIHWKTLSNTISHKFGDDLLTSEDMIKRFKQIKDLGFNLAGIHFHCGSGASGSQNFAFALDIAQECMKIGRNVGHSMRLLDIGGGFPAGELPLNLIQILERLKGDGEIERVMAEPGRHLATNPFSLVTHVIGKRNKGSHTMYHLNDGVFHILNCVLMDNTNLVQNNKEWYAEWSDKQQESKQQNKFEVGTLVGMTCHGQDMIAKNVKLPYMEIGDAIVINGMGAYTTSAVSNFNGMIVQEKVEIWQPQLTSEKQKNNKES